MSKTASIRLDRLLANLGYGSRREMQMLARNGRIALDERIDLPRPRQRSDPRFGVLEKKILDRVLQQPGEETPANEPVWPSTPAHGLRWAI